MLKRLAIAVALLSFALALLAAVLPSSPSGIDCGSLISPDYTDEQAADLLKRAEDVYNTGFYQDEAIDVGNDVVVANASCEDARDARRTVLFLLMGAGIVGPAVIIFVAGGMPRRGRAAT